MEDEMDNTDLKLAFKTLGFAIVAYPPMTVSDVVYKRTKHKKHIPNCVADKVNTKLRRLNREWLECADRHRLADEEKLRQNALRLSKQLKKGGRIINGRRI
jgi:hypothetical protein